MKLLRKEIARIRSQLQTPNTDDSDTANTGKLSLLV